jgi:hypothetical protein
MTERGEHMDDVSIAAYLDNQLHGRAREHFESHIAQCAECRKAVIDAEQLLKTMRARHGRRSLVILAAAVVVLAGIRLRGFGREHEQPLRGAPDPLGLAAVAPVGEVPGTGLRFVWASLPGAISYKLEVTDALGSNVWTASPADTSADLPRSVILQTGRNYFWRVDAVAANGTERSTGTHEFRVNK